MKIKDVAHNHSLTDLLKVSIFSLLMLAPMINVGVRSAYVICNKNAYQSYSGYNIETNTELASSIESGLNYQVSTYEYTGNTNMQNLISFSQLDITSSNGTFTNWYAQNKDSIKYFRIAYQNSTTRLLFFNASMSQIDYYNLASSTYQISFTPTTNTTLTSNEIIYRVYEQQVGNSLDNVFEYSVNQLTESPLYNWVENTAIYSGVALMNTQLGITQPVISLLVVYWLLLTIIYVIIDIVIRVFTWLTHMIGSKTA